MLTIFYIISGSLLLGIVAAGIYALRNLYLEEKKILFTRQAQQTLEELRKKVDAARTARLTTKEHVFEIDEVFVAYATGTKLKEMTPAQLHKRDGNTLESFEYQY